MEVFEALAQLAAEGDITIEQYEEAFCDEELAQALISYFILED